MLNLYAHQHNGVTYYVEQGTTVKLFDEDAIMIKEFPNKLAMLMWFELGCNWAPSMGGFRVIEE